MGERTDVALLTQNPPAEGSAVRFRQAYLRTLL
jgi:hypothetical protein